MSQTIEEFYKGFYEDLDTSRRNDSLVKADDFFTNLMFEYLQDLGEIEDPTVCSYRDNSGIQLNGFQFADDFSSVDIFVSIFSDTDSLLSVAPSDVNAALNRGANVFRRAISGKIEQFNKDTDVFDCVNTIYQHLNDIHDLHISVLTNGVVKNMDLQPTKFGQVNVSYRLWDMDRLYKCSTSGQMHEPITIDCQKYLGAPLFAVKGGKSDKTQVYLAIIPGKFLADIYQEFGAKLLERNVRAFLQLKGKVNKGIRETLINEPGMFLAYNNGITVTASAVLKEGDGNSVVKIKSISDFQIVNGGQTTVSLFKAKTDNSIEVDFSQVYVQMKLAVVENSVDMDEVVPNISRYSNSQNSVQIADFSSNDPYQRKMETLSRATWTPALNGKKPINWFYERTRGQYAEQLGLVPTPSKRRDFKESHPLITKTDLAKVLCSWDENPTAVALGSQKCFAIFVEHLKNSPAFEPTQQYYQRCIAKTIILRKIERLVLEQRFGGYKADIVAYAYFKLMRMTGGKIDLDDIWESQDISEEFSLQLTKIIIPVQKYITTAEAGGNISEFCKTQRCVQGVDALQIDLDGAVKNQLLENPLADDAPVASLAVTTTPEQQETIDEAMKVSANEWKALASWAKLNNILYSWQRSLLFSMATLRWRQKQPTYKQAARALEAREKAISLGFTMQ